MSSIPGCNGFFHNQNLLTSFGTYEQSSIQIVRKQVELHKPNVLLIVPRYTRTLKQPILDIETDEVLRIMNENLAFYERLVEALFGDGGCKRCCAPFLRNTDFSKRMQSSLVLRVSPQSQISPEFILKHLVPSVTFNTC